MIERISVHREIKLPLWEQYSNGTCSITRTSEIEVDEFDDYNKAVEIQTNELDLWADAYINRKTSEIENWIKSRGAEGLGHKFTYLNDLILPHVTSIITPDEPAIPYIKDHGELGTWFDTTFKYWAKTGELDPLPFENKGNISQTSDEMIEVFTKWLEKYKEFIKITSQDIICTCEEYLYTGTADCFGEIKCGDEWKKACFDVKKSKIIKGEILEKYGMQIAAYMNCFPDLEVGVILSPYNAPIVFKKEDYFGKFLVKRGEYKERFGK